MRYIMHTPPSLPLPSWTPSHDEDRSLKEEGRRWRSFRFSRSHGALRSHRRACANAKRDKFQHACFVWETSIKPEKKKSAYEGERGGGSKCINQIIPAHWRLSVPRGSSSAICTDLRRRHLFKQNSFLPALHWRLMFWTHDSQDLLDDLNLLQCLYL